MPNKKNTGSYYTPEILSDFLINHIFTKYLTSKNLSILEPSCGDGQFISSLFKHIHCDNYTKFDLTICDINDVEIAKTLEFIPNSNKTSLHVVNNDYLDFFLNNDSKYSLIIGNPPYIRKKNLLEQQIKICEEVHNKVKSKYPNLLKSTNKINNIWTAFVESAIMSLEDNGVMCFVIPAEIMHVNYTKELRRLIQIYFDKVEIFAFNELIFDGIQQDVVALIGIKGVENNDNHGVSFYQVNRLEDLNEPKFTELHNNIHRLQLDKWTNYILTDQELDYIENLKSQFFPINKYCKRAQVGIVSAANDYFILGHNEVTQNGLNEVNGLIKPILPKGSILPNVLNFTDGDLKRLFENNKRVSFVQFSNLPKNLLGTVENQYIEKGEQSIENSNKGQLHKRYKMLKRDNWYHIPSVWYSEGLFIKRSHMFPKIIVNSTNALATDSFYRLEMNENYNIRNLAFAFYNTLTFILSELEGRFYGGGVLELTPIEFKNLSIPYSALITDAQFTELDMMLRANMPIDKILDFTDKILFTETTINIHQLRNIRMRLVNRRIKKQEI